jgi:hypothetical protein
MLFLELAPGVPLSAQLAEILGAALVGTGTQVTTTMLGGRTVHGTDPWTAAGS